MISGKYLFKDNTLRELTENIQVQSAVAYIQSATADFTYDGSNNATIVQSDLDTLLASSAVFTGDVTINSVATLDIFHGMGDAIAIVNGNVDISATADMDATKLQETIDQVLENCLVK